jgi:uncharacterized protein YijF (DUF1287 family)
VKTNKQTKKPTKYHTGRVRTWVLASVLHGVEWLSSSLNFSFLIYKVGAMTCTQDVCRVDGSMTGTYKYLINDACHY